MVPIKMMGMAEMTGIIVIGVVIRIIAIVGTSPANLFP
jgi:hypothetical protein